MQLDIAFGAPSKLHPTPTPRGGPNSIVLKDLGQIFGQVFGDVLGDVFGRVFGKVFGYVLGLNFCEVLVRFW